MTSTQTASHVILVRPTGFGYDTGTEASNAYQRRLPDRDARLAAALEFDGLLEALRRSGIGTTVLDPADKEAPSAVFPNNWFSTHADGTLVLYPMLATTRRAERDPHLAEVLRREGFALREVVDLSDQERGGLYLEGTGSLVLERVRKLAFACVSPRTREDALNAWCARFHHTAIPFTATVDGTLTGQPVYHTNVVMSIGEGFAVVCFEAMPYPAERAEVEEELRKAGKEIVPIMLEQMRRFTGNVLQLRSQPALPAVGRDDPPSARPTYVILLSETAFHALRPEQRITLERHGGLVPVPVPTIEAVGGGSVRCMLAENFLPLRP